MKIKNIKNIKEALKPKLTEYLKLKGLKNISGKFQCVNKEAHEHEDLGKLSAAIIPGSNNSLLQCFVENRTFDIFEAYHIIEKKPINGTHFWLAVESLCKQFNIPYEFEDEFSPRQIEIGKKRDIVTNLHTISLKNINSGAKYYKQRGLSKDKIKKYRIGFLTPELIDTNIRSNFKKFWDFSLNIVEYPSLVIPVYNEYNQYLGLILRQMENCPKESKYINIKIDSKLTFNRNNIKHRDYIYVVEGAFDGISLFPEMNVMGLCMNNLVNGDIEYLADKKFKTVYLTLDADNDKKPIATNGILRGVLNLKNVDSDIKIVKLPEGIDPDEFMKEHTIEEFKGLQTIDGIYYLINKVKQEELPLDKLFNFIVGCPDIIRKESYVSKISEELKIGKRNLMKKLNSLEDSSSNINLVDYIKEKDYFTETVEEFIERAWNREFKGIPSGYAMFDRYIGGYENTVYMLIGHPEQGKCWGVDTPIIMNDGLVKKVQDIKVGDFVLGTESQPVRVISTTSGKEEMYTIVPNKGNSFTCNKSHILVLHHNGKTKELTVSELLKKTPAYRERVKLIRQGVEFVEKEVPYDPYFIGQWIGDGSTEYPYITQNEPELYEYYNNFAKDNNLVFKIRKQKERCDTYAFISETVKPNPLGKYVKTIVRNGEKRIPKDYLITSRKNRLRILAGLIDSDGYFYSGMWEMTTKYNGLKDDILYLARSLGFLATENKPKVIKGRVYHRILITGEIDCVPIKLKRKKAPVRISRKNALHSGFAIEPLGIGTYYGFTLEKGSNGRCLLGDFTITHNTVYLLNTIHKLLQNDNNFVAFYSIDDGLMRIIPRMLSLLSGNTSKKMKEPSEDSKEQWWGALKKFQDYKDRFVFKDGANVRTIWDLDGYIKIHSRMAQEKNKQLILIIDNVHALTFSGKLTATEDSRKMSSIIKRIPQIYNCPIIATGELPKSAGEKATGKDIKDSTDWWYSGRCISSISTGASHLQWERNGKIYSIFEVYYSKNQTGDSWHGSLFYKFDPINNMLIECTEDESAILRKKEYLI